jgi:RHS repeat-associated protein
MSDKSGVSSQVLSLPTGGGALQGIGETFAPDLHTGTGNFTVPIALSSGRNGFQPQISLIYSTGIGNGPYGLGWRLNVPGISRTTRKGIPRYDDRTDIFLLSGAEDLVPVEALAGATRFQPRTEGRFDRVLHHRDPDNDYWEVRSKDGLVGFYGTPKPPDAGPDWTDPAVVRDPDPRKPHRIFAWKLTRTVDPFGNRIEYLYERDRANSDGPHRWDQLYLSQVRYGDFGDPADSRFLITVDFSYDDRPDPFSDYRPGFEIRTVRRCRSIEISTHAGTDALARSCRLTYLDQLGLPAEQLPPNGVSLLSQIEVEGRDGELSQALPFLAFGYTRFAPDRRNLLPLTGPETSSLTLADPAFAQTDLSGNGLPDIVELNGSARYWRNLGNGAFDRSRTMKEAPSVGLADPGVQLVDADGDGRIDLLVTTAQMSGFYSLGFDGQWDRRSFRRFQAAPSFNLEDPEVQMVDLDGDGVTDAIRSGNRLECFFNDGGLGWTRTRAVERRSLDEFPDVTFSDPRVKWGDMSGDSLQDIVLVYSGNVGYWPNLGYGDWGARIHMRNSPRFPAGYDPRRVLVGDVDGDGLADIVYVDNHSVSVWINQSGNGWSDPIVIEGTPEVADVDAVRLSDILGNGTGGLLWSAGLIGRSRRNLFFLDFTSGRKPYLLDEIDNNIGAVTRVTYASSTHFYLEDQQDPKTRWKTPLPFPVQVVARVEVIDEFSKGKLTTEYRYHHGYWDGAEREFRGFGMVEQHDSEAFAPDRAAVPEARQYRFDLVDFPSATSTFLGGINNNGQMAGTERDANGIFHSFAADAGAFAMFDPPGFSGTAFPGISNANGINDRGDIAGVVTDDDGSRSRAYVRSGGEFSLYTDPRAGSGTPSRGTEISSINNAGTRAGSFTGDDDVPHGFLRNGDTTTLLEDHPNVPANTGTFIFDINNAGQMVGGYFDAAGDIQHGFLADGKTFTTIDVPGSSSTWLNSINDLGQMAGSYFDDTAKIWRGFVTDGRTFTNLDLTVPGLPPGTFPRSINNAGTIVGYCGDVEHAARPGIRGFVATPVPAGDGLRSPGSQHLSPPACTKTWFHQGPVGDAGANWVDLDLSTEFWPGDPPLFHHQQGVDAFLATLPNRQMRRDALRALRGSVLRIEFYALDGTDRAARPFTVTEHAYGLRLEASAVDGESPAVFFPHRVAQRTTAWERGDDPMTRFTFTDTADYDAFGQVLRVTGIACPRGWRSAADTPDATYLASRLHNTYAQPTNSGTYIQNRVARTTSLEIRNDGQVTVAALHGLPDDSPAMRLYAQSYHYYDGPAFEGLPFGQVGPFGAAVRTERLVLTEEILEDAYKSGAAVLDPPEIPPYLDPSGPPPWTPEYPDEFRTLLPALAGYVFHPGGPDARDARGYFARTERCRYDFQTNAGGSGRGLVLVERDPFGRDITIGYDPFDFLPVQVTDAAQLAVQAQYDYRVLQPKQVTDANGNRKIFTFTPLGLVSEIFLQGKPGSGDGDQAEPDTRLTYDFLAFQNSRRLDPENPAPISVHTIQRVHHDSENDVPMPERNDTIEHREYSDGFGRLLQVRRQVEDRLFGDPVFGGSVLPAAQKDQPGTNADVTGRERAPGSPANVVVSGWQVYDNKGRVVRTYEPFYAGGFEYGQPVDSHFGQKTETFYDPRGNVVRTVRADGSEQRVVFGVPGTIPAPDLSNPDVYEPTPWEAYTYDADDNAGRTHPVAAAGYLHCWNTPSSITVDALGRTVLAISRNRDPAAGDPLPPIGELRIRYTYDIRGNLLAVQDALDREAFRHTYDLANQLLRIENIDAGTRRTAFDTAGNVVEYRDSKGTLCLHAYDEVNRPIRRWARDNSGEVITQREHLIYGDSAESGFTRDEAAAANLLGKPYQHYDEAGRLTFERYDFKGNLLEKARQVIGGQAILSVFNPPPPDWTVQAFRVDWQPAPGGTLQDRAEALLDATEYHVSTTYDALNRIKIRRYPEDVDQERKELRPSYNRAGALGAVSFDDDLYVREIAYNAKGQCVLVAYGNGVMTRSAFDVRTSRLLRMRTESYTQPDAATYRPAANLLQDLAYEYDLVSNLTRLHDRTPGSGIPNTALGRDALDRDFVFDALYRLHSAGGRECDLPPDVPWDGSPRCTDLTRVRAYTETYQYDDAGNIARRRHGVTREFALVPGTDRLATVTAGQESFQYVYDPSGNLVEETTSRHFEWDHQDRLRVYRTQAGTAEPSVHAHYLYDSGGERVAKLVRKQGGTVETTVYIDGFFEHQRAIDGTSVQENNTLHVMGNPTRCAVVRVGRPFPDDATPPVKYHIADHLGSSSVVIGGADAAASAFVNREEYTPYGETSFGSFARKRYRFSGKERDEESGLSYHSARYMAPWLGRWVSADPLTVYTLGSDINVYAYVRGRPMIAADPGGLDDGGGGDDAGDDPEDPTSAEPFNLPPESLHPNGTASSETLDQLKGDYEQQELEAKATEHIVNAGSTINPAGGAARVDAAQYEVVGRFQLSPKLSTFTVQGAGRVGVLGDKGYRLDWGLSASAGTGDGGTLTGMATVHGGPGSSSTTGFGYYGAVGAQRTSDSTSVVTNNTGAYTLDLDPSQKDAKRTLTFDVFLNGAGDGSVGGNKVGTTVNVGGGTGLTVPLSGKEWSLITELGLTYNFSLNQSASSFTRLEGIGVALTNADRDAGNQFVFTVEANQETHGGGNTVILIIGYGWARATYKSLYGVPGN